MQNSFSKRFKKLRLDKEISQTKIGLILNVAQQTIDKWERGINEPNYDMLIRLATFFDVPLDYLLGRSNDMYFSSRGNNETTATVYGNNSVVAGNIQGNVNIKK